MKLLLDTHALIWWLEDDPRLPAAARSRIRDPESVVYVSAVTAWEITVKRWLGKLEIPDDWADFIADDAFRRLDISWAHAVEVGRLPDVHRDPFDRLLVAQARIEGLTLVTHDARIAEYGTEILWDE